MAFLAMVLLATVPVLGKLRAEIPIDLLEVNHVYDDTGNHRFAQVIAWERDAATGRYFVRDWFVLEQARFETRSVVVTAGGVYEIYRDQDKFNRKLRSSLFLETHTAHDREVENKKLLPAEYRLRLPNVK